MKDLFEFDQSAVLKTNDRLKSKRLKKENKANLEIITRTENAAKLLKDGFPKEKEYFAIKTSGETDAGSFFSHALNLWGNIEEMYLATWTISKANISRLENAIKTGKLKYLTMVFSSTLKPANPALYSSLVSALSGFSNVKLKEVNSHAKTFSISNGKDFITVSGSANWSKNPRIENYLILNDKDLFNHHKEWMSELTDLR